MECLETTVPKDNPTIAGVIASPEVGRTVSVTPAAPAPKSGTIYRILSHSANESIAVIGRDEDESVRLRSHAENRLNPIFNAFGGEKSRFTPTGGRGWGVYFKNRAELRQLLASLAFTARSRKKSYRSSFAVFGEQDFARADKLLARFGGSTHKIPENIKRKRKNPLDLLGREG